MCEASDQPVFWNNSKVHLSWTISWHYIYSRSTTRCYNVWQWRDKEVDGSTAREKKKRKRSEKRGGGGGSRGRGHVNVPDEKRNTCSSCSQSYNRLPRLQTNVRRTTASSIIQTLHLYSKYTLYSDILSYSVLCFALLYICTQDCWTASQV